MLKLLSKNRVLVAILAGIVFLFAGATTASAAEKVEWLFEYTIVNPFLGGLGGGVTGQVSSYIDKASCDAGEKAYASDTNYLIHKYTITKSCYSTTTANAAVARNVALANIRNADLSEDPLLKNIHCNIINGALGTGGSIADCVPLLTYYVVYKPASWLLIGSGYIFDATLILSIDSNFVNQDFVASTWTVVRDFSNMFFIFILLYTGVQTILDIGNWKNTIKLVIIMALLINFSLFFTKVVIDAGNVLAVGVYNSMGLEKSAENQSFQSVGSVPERNISENLAMAFEPQRFLDTAGKVEALDATIVFLIATIVSGYAGYVFFKVALLFVGRLIAFWFLMIVSPFAFISIALPSKANKFQEWLDTLISQAFIAPIFLFFIYIIMQVINGGNGILAGLIKSSPTTGAFTFDKVLAPVIIATILIMALQKALGFAEDMAGDFGKLGSDMASKAMGLAAVAPTMAGAATGGLIRGVGAATSWTAKKAGAAGGKFDKFGQGIQSTGKFVGSASTYIDPYKLPKHLSKIPVVGGVAGGAAKAVGGALGVSDVRNVLKGGEKGAEEAKARKKTADNKAAVNKFIEDLHKDAQGNVRLDPQGRPLDQIKSGKTLDDQEVKDAIIDKRDAFELSVANAEALLAQTPNFSQLYAQTVVSKNRAKRDLAEFTQAQSKAAEKHKELKEND